MFKSENKRDFGTRLENFAENVLKQQGCKIVELNFNCKLGEIDIIAKDSNVYCFVEVRYRKQSQFGGATASVDKRKQQKIIKAAQLFLQQNRLTNSAQCRFDVFAIEGNLQKLNYQWIKDAFQTH